MASPRYLQLTLAFIKPESSQLPFVINEVRKAILSSGFLVVRSRRLLLSLEDAQKFYAEHEGKFFYNRLISYMTSGPIQVHLLARPDAILVWRRLLGPTRSYRAQFIAPHTIRGRFGVSDTRNVAHGSDSDEAARRETAIMFPNFDWDEWFEREHKYFLCRQVQLDEKKFQHLSP